MQPTPSKRRKTSPTTSVDVGGDESTSRSQYHASTRNRASYQSPTKSSLSRSHPSILARSPGRRTSEGKGKGLRHEVLLGKTVTKGSKSDTAGPSPAGLPPSPTEGLVAVQSLYSQRSPLGPRQPSIRKPEGYLSKTGQNISDEPSPKSVTTNLPNHDFSHRNMSDIEPELPPTPTQLGLSPKPDRPRGLAASSSPSSRGSRRSHLRNGHVDTSSPLKPKERMSTTRTEGYHDGTIPALSKEALESDAQQVETESHQHETEELRNSSQPSGEMLEKRKARDNIKIQLARLRTELSRIESALGGADIEEDLDSDLIAILSTTNISCDPQWSAPNARPSPNALKDPVALGVNPLAFLRAFAPGDLRLTTTTKTSSHQGKLLQAHVLDISAPPPWPPHVFSATFRVTCDVETKRVISITGANIRPRHGAGIKDLRYWMESRLRNPLHKFDVGTLVWGLGMWWKEAVVRAQFFHHIDTTKAAKTVEAQTSYQPNQAVKAAKIQALIPYIGKSFVELIPAEPYSNRASTNEARKYRQTRLLLKWDLELDWAGEVHTEIDVAGTKVSAKGQEGVKTVFAGLRIRNGLDTAVRQIVEVCGGWFGNGKKKNTK
jgi:hypothetical protein